MCAGEGIWVSLDASICSITKMVPKWGCYSAEILVFLTLLGLSHEFQLLLKKKLMEFSGRGELKIWASKTPRKRTWYFYFFNPIISRKMKLSEQSPVSYFSAVLQVCFLESHVAPSVTELGSRAVLICLPPAVGSASSPCLVLPPAHAVLVVPGLFPSVQRLQPLFPGFVSQLWSHHLRRDRAGPVQPFSLSQRQP